MQKQKRNQTYKMLEWTTLKATNLETPVVIFYARESKKSIK